MGLEKTLIFFPYEILCIYLIACLRNNYILIEKDCRYIV